MAATSARVAPSSWPPARVAPLARLPARYTIGTSREPRAVQARPAAPVPRAATRRGVAIHEGPDMADRDDRYRPQEIEQRWQAIWRERDAYRTPDDSSRPKFYCLDFFPYPSGDGLSVGHCRNYVPTDAISRFQGMRGFNVLHPMGWDAFGLPAENYAIKMGVSPRVTTEQAIANFRRQIDAVGFAYDWE